MNTLLKNKRLTPCLQLQSSWEQTYIKQLVKTYFYHKKNNALIITDAIKYLARLKWVKKCFWRIKEGWTEKVVNFHLNILTHSQIIRYQIRTFFSLINKDGTQIKTKYNISLLKPYLDSDETKVTCDENPLPVQSTNNHMILKKLILQV